MVDNLAGHQEWERQFIRDIRRWVRRGLTLKQMAKLRSIHERMFGTGF